MIISQASITIKEIEKLAKKRRKYGDFWDRLKTLMRQKGFTYGKPHYGERDGQRCHFYVKDGILHHELHHERTRKKPEPGGANED